MSFPATIILLETILKDGEYKHVPSIGKYLQIYLSVTECNANKIIFEIEDIEKEFWGRFKDFDKIENRSKYIVPILHDIFFFQMLTEQTLP